MKSVFTKTILGSGLVLMVSITSTPVIAETAGTIATGWGTANLVPLRLNLQQSVSTFYNPDPERIWPFMGYMDGSFYYLGSGSSNKKKFKRATAKHLKAYSLGGFFRFSRDPTFLNEHAWPYIDAGLGAAWLSKEKIVGRHLGMHFQVETKLGCGIRWGSQRQFDIGYRYTNFSNGFLTHPNDTINLHMLVLGYWYP